MDDDEDFEDEEMDEVDDEGEEFNDREESAVLTEAPTLAEGPRKTTPYMTKFERSRVLGARALQISMNAPVMVELDGETDPLLIAEKELLERVIPFVVRRYLPDNTYEDWKISELLEIE